jgi:peptidoglycan/LPS O-acetylase OafA/YrhL
MTGARASSRESQHHITSLDGVRGVAIGLVLLVHLLWANTQTGQHLMDFIGKVRTAGWVGVDLFFALSGFLITGILFDTLQSDHYFKNFYARRILRIFPLYYGVLLILFAVLHPSTFAQGRPLYILLAYLQNTPLWWHGITSGLTIDLTGHLWSLAVEEQFYLVWPILIFLIRDRRKLLWTALALAALAPITRAILLAHGASFDATYKLTICRADSLLSGAWLALIVRGNLRAKVLRYAAPVFALALFLCAAIAWKTGNFDWQINRAINLYGYSVIAIGSTAFIGMSLRPGTLTVTVMRLNFLRFLGKYSYGIYIFHQIIFALVQITIAPILHAHIQSKFLFHLILPIAVLCITIPLAWFSYNFYEQPFLKLKKRFNYVSRQSRQEAEASVPSTSR